MESSLVILKPDAVARGLIGKIVSRFENAGYSISEMKMMKISEDLASKHYADLKDKPFFGELVDFICSGNVLVMRVDGNNVVNVTRKMIGATNPVEAMPGTIRGDFGNIISSNIIHASDSNESAIREINLFFGV